jgi:hypothetical protein
LALGVGIVVAVSTVGVQRWLAPGPAPLSASRFIVVESPDRGAASAPKPAAPETRVAVVPPRPALAEPAALTDPPPAAPRRAEPAGALALTRHFAQREGELQACFERHASALSGQPQITVNFEVGASGTVQSATLEPSSLASTPLGGCLLGVARSTSFGAVAKPLRFSIPVRARSVSR